MENKQKRKNNKKKIVTSLMAAALALILLLSGTFAWFYTTNEINEFDGNGTIMKQKNSAVLHDDFDKWAEDGVHRKDVFVENTGEDSLFVRIRLDEYMEIDGESVINGAKKADESTWQRHTKESTVFAEHWSWKQGGEATEYRPNEEGKQGVVSRYDENGDDTLNGASGLELTHNGKATEVITMADYKGLNETEKQAFAGWIMDEDGYAYWYEKLPAGEATGRLLNQVSLKDTISEKSKYYYGINVVFETVDEDDLDAWLNGTATEDGSRPEEVSEDAKDLLEKLSEQMKEQTEIQKKVENAPEGTVLMIDGIEWLLLQKDEESQTAEMITAESVETRRYHGEAEGWKWSTSELCKWLNEEWYEELSLDFKSIIKKTEKLTNIPEANYEEDLSDVTVSNVYLLSLGEYEHYYKIYGSRLLSENNDGYWWLRSPETGGTAVSVIDNTTGESLGGIIIFPNAVRPVVTVKYK